MAVILQVEHRRDADLNVYVTESRGEADLMVCRVERAQAREPGWWFYTDSRAEAEYAIRLTNSRAESDLNICYVDSRGEAGWRVVDHPWKDRL